MTRKSRSAPRCAEVIRLLEKHSALSSGSIRLLLDPPLSRRRVLDILGTLGKRGVVHKRISRMFGGHAVFYELSSMHRVQLGIPRVYWGTLVHNDYCSLVHAYLERMFPRARLIREHAIRSEESVAKVMQFDQDYPDAIPDILLVYPSTNPKRPIYIAIEIERMAKSEIRLLRKFSKYASGTMLDGVIYLSEDASLLRLLRRFYQTKIAPEALRVVHYPNHFLLTGSCPTRRNFRITDLRNSEDISVSLTSWMQKLASTEYDLRRDAAFTKPTPVVVDHEFAATRP